MGAGRLGRAAGTGAQLRARHPWRGPHERHASATDGDAKLFRKGPSKEAKSCFIGHALMENRNDLVVGAVATRVSSHAERLAALHPYRATCGAGDSGHLGRRQGL